MKKLLLILLCLPMIGFGQTDDVLKLQNEVSDINYRMDKHHKQFYGGVKLTIGGLGITALGVLVSVNPAIYIGSAFVLVGNIVILNSHKWFKNRDEKGDSAKQNKIRKRTEQLKTLLRNGEISKKEYNEAIEDLNTLKQ
jgi:uncharacterized membrane protein